MKDFWIGLTKKQHKMIQKEVDCFQKEQNRNGLGWGCVANIRVYTGEVHIGLLTNKEMNKFYKAWESAKKGKAQ